MTKFNIIYKGKLENEIKYEFVSIIHLIEEGISQVRSRPDGDTVLA